MPSMTSERRKHERHCVLIKVALRDEQRFRHLYATNLSRGGLFLSTKNSLPVGQEVIVRLIHPLTGAAFEVKAQVANIRRAQDESVRGCGLKFTAFDETIQRQLFRFVKGVLEPEPDPEPEHPEAKGEPVEDITSPPDDASSNTLRAHAMLLRGLALAREGNLIGAAHLLARATSLDPTEETLWSTLRDVEGQLEAAAKAQEAKEDDQGEPRPTVPVETSSSLPEEDVVLSLTDDMVIDQDKGEPEVLELEEPAVLEPTDRRKAKLLYEAAKDCYGTGEIDDAINYLEKSLGSDPSFAPTYYALAGILAEERDELERGLFLCRKAVDLDPDNQEYHEALQSLETTIANKQ